MPWTRQYIPQLLVHLVRRCLDCTDHGELSADARPMRRSSVGRASVERRSTHDRCRSTLDRRSTNVGRASLECRSCVGRASVDSRPTSRPTHDRQSLNVEPTLSVDCRSTVDRSPADSRSPVGRHSCVVKLLFVEHQQRGLRVTVLGTLRIYWTKLSSGLEVNGGNTRNTEKVLKILEM